MKEAKPGHSFARRVERNCSYIGHGTEKFVYEHPNDSQKVVAVFYNERYPAVDPRLFYYIAKTLHLLFPDNIPDIYSSSPGMNIRQRIYGEEVSNLSLADCIRLTIPLQNALESLGFGLDDFEANWTISDKGSVMYLDKIFLNPEFDSKFLKRAIENKLEGQQKKKALGYLDRIKIIKNEVDKARVDKWKSLTELDLLRLPDL